MQNQEFISRVDVTADLGHVLNGLHPDDILIEANTGDHLARALIVSGLSNGAREATRAFEGGTGNAYQVGGTIVHLSVDGQSEPVPIFLTDEHAKAWRDLTEAP